MMRAKRNSNIEILRIISMFLIVLSHYAIHNGVDTSQLPLGGNRFLLEFCALGSIGVTIFVMITGYFGINKSNPFRLKRLFSIIFQTFFYSMAIYFIFVLCGKEDFSVNGLVTNVLPIMFRKYWFISVYVLLYIFTPYINTLLSSLDRKKHLCFIILLVGIFSVLPMLTTQPFYGNELVQFFMFYTIGAYLGKYKDNFFSKKNNSWRVLIISIIIVAVSIVFFDLMGQMVPFLGEHSNYLLNRGSALTIAISVSIFALFCYKKQFTNNLVNKIALCVFGVYLISDNYLVRGVLWDDILHVPDVVESPVLIVHMVTSVVVVFAVCAVIEYVRLCTLEKLFSITYEHCLSLISKARKDKGRLHG